MRMILPFIIIAALTVSIVNGDAQVSFTDCKTFFQTNSRYDPLISMGVDCVVVHGNFGAMKGWQDAGYPVGRMFFADSDDLNDYCSGRWDGISHIGDAEHNAAGEVIMCAGVRPYMLPTDKWIEYLKGKVDVSVDAGAVVILPEEPLGHINSGYEASFKALWQQRYGIPWQAESESAYAAFLTAQLKSELYAKLERELMLHTKQRAVELKRDISFVVPIHSLYSNLASHLVAPLGTSKDIGDIDGYVGQIWTGPVNWTLANYDGADPSFFSSAYALYDYFVQLAVGTDKKLWLLVDPVEDDPKHKWQEFKQWYEYCVVSMLLMRDIDKYEIMPWPDRIFLPGFETGGSTPAPESYRQEILSVTQVLQDVTLGGKLCLEDGSVYDPPKIAVAVSDTLMWQSNAKAKITNIYSQLLPLIRRGIPVSSFPIERYADKDYINSFDIIVLSYEHQLPLDYKFHYALNDWVMQGGVLIILGKESNELDGVEEFWWYKKGFASPMAHLLSTLGYDENNMWQIRDGLVIYEKTSPAEFTRSSAASEKYIDLVKLGAKNIKRELTAPGYFYMKRGDYIIAQAETSPLSINRPLIDVFNMDSHIKTEVKLSPGQCGVYKDMTGFIARCEPAVLHTTHRLVNSWLDDGVLKLTVKGPSQTGAKVWIYTAGKTPETISVSAAAGDAVEFTRNEQDNLLTLTFPNLPEGANIVVKFR